jgi:predicted ATP-dependent endonuclease of OLD family
MRIKNLSVVNFRSLRDLTMDNLGNLNILVGKNSAGKSNILEAIDVFLRGISPVLGEQDASIPDYIWSRQDALSEISFVFEFEFEKGDLKFSSEFIEAVPALRKENHKVVIAKRLSKSPKMAWHLVTLSINDLIICHEGQVEQGEISANLTYASIGQEVLKQIAGIVSNTYGLIGFNRLTASSTPTPGQRVPAIPQDTIQSIIQIESTGEPEKDDLSYELTRQFGEICPDNELLVTGSSVRVREGSTRIQLPLLGVGTQTMIGLIHDLLDVKGITLIEEPEIHLHADFQRKAFRRFREISEKHQVFITTHSTTFLDECDYDEVWYINKTDGTTTARITKGLGDLREVALDLGIRPSDVLMANNVLLVEGWTEKIVLPRWAKQLGKSLRPPRVNVVQMGGAGKGRYHLSLWNQLVKDIGIPVFILLDGDDIARKEAQKLKRKKTIPSTRIHNLSKSTIEDYYPSNMVVEGLSSIFSLNQNQEQSLRKLLKKTNRVNAIKHFINKHSLTYSGNWKIALAEFVTERTTAQDLAQEIKDVILRMDDVFQ